LAFVLLLLLLLLVYRIVARRTGELGFSSRFSHRYLGFTKELEANATQEMATIWFPSAKFISDVPTPNPIYRQLR